MTHEAKHVLIALTLLFNMAGLLALAFFYH